MLAPAVLDASAILALLLDEPGADVVLSHLAGASTSAVNLAEVAAKLVRIGGTLENAIQQVSALGVEVVPFDANQAAESARLIPITMKRGLSLGDRCCLALASLSNRPAITGDRAWAELELPIEVWLIR